MALSGVPGRCPAEGWWRVGVPSAGRDPGSRLRLLPRLTGAMGAVGGIGRGHLRSNASSPRVRNHECLHGRIADLLYAGR